MCLSRKAQGLNKIKTNCFGSQFNNSYVLGDDNNSPFISSPHSFPLSQIAGETPRSAQRSNYSYHQSQDYRTSHGGQKDPQLQYNTSVLSQPVEGYHFVQN
mmetsp:Transcript_41468/g.36846  ORF Transcript_41468/g.36846 Transcript_41468/m.36846 type:complete len:101 (-) Transcript_41468:5898-6200(-)